MGLEIKISLSEKQKSGFGKSSPDFPVFCPAVNPRTCTDLHRVWASNRDDGEFQLVYH